MGLKTKKLLALLWKCLILRLKNYLLSACELILPILIVSVSYALFSEIKGLFLDSFIPNMTDVYPGIEVKFAPNYADIGCDMAYAPTNNFTKSIMSRFASSFPRKLKQFKNETELEKWLLKKTLKPDDKRESIGIIFLNDKDDTYKYIIRTNSKKMTTNDLKTSSYYSVPPNYVSLDTIWKTITASSFLSVQRTLDKVLLATKVNYTKDFPQLKTLPSKTDITRYIIAILYFLILFTYVFLVVAVVRDTIQEKSSGIKEMMRIMGLSSWMIWMHWLVYLMIIQLPLTIILTILLSVLKPHFINANPIIVWLLLFLFTLDYIVIFFVATCFFNRPIRATILCVMIWLIFHPVAFHFAWLPDSFETYQQVLLSLIPLINLCWTFHSLVSFRELQKEWGFSYLFTKGYTGSNISAGGSITIFILQIIFFCIVLLYLDAVKPGRYGVAKPIYFLCIWCKNKLTKDHKDYDSSSTTFSSPNTFEPPPKDLQVGIEIRGLKKVYGWTKRVTAVEKVDLDIYKGEIMVLLGHNGAGKTTTLSMIAGMFSPTKGTILVDGKDIHRELGLTHFRKSLGICTQDNLYFPKLSVIEHLIFFGKLKGLSCSQAKEDGMYLLNFLKISENENKRVSKLSGGMKRRLCLAISLTGNPKVLILDEPTSGLDPENRQQIWNIILSLRGERTVIITTHHMEEADVLGDRIAIMDNGKVVCCGTTMFLKKLYGTGYHIHVQKAPKYPTSEITFHVEQNVKNFGVKEVSKSQVDYSISDGDVDKLPNLFSALERNKATGGIQGMSVTCTTLEDVFLRVAEISSEDHESKVEPKKSKVSDQLHHSLGDYEKYKGCLLWLRQFEALFIKRFTLRYRSYVSIICKMVFACLLFIAMAVVGRFEASEPEVQRALELNLGLYPDAVSHFYYGNDGYNKSMLDIAKRIVEENKGKVEIHSNVTDADVKMFLERQIRDDYFDYCRRVLLVLVFKNNTFEVQFQSVLSVHLPAIAVNLATNIIMKASQPNMEDVKITNYPYVTTNVNEKCLNFGQQLLYGYVNPLAWMFCLFCVFVIFMPDFIPFFTEERVSDFKHQQMIAGLHPIFYWAVSFLFDFCFYMFNVLIWIISFLIFTSGDLITFSSETVILLLLTMTLYGVSGTFFVYLITFLTKNSVSNTAVFMLLNFVIGVVASFVVYILDFFKNLALGHSWNLLLINLLSLNPTFAAIMCIGKIALKTFIQKVERECGGEISQIELFKVSTKELLRMHTNEDRHGVLIYILHLALDWILFFFIIVLIEMSVFRKIKQTIFKNAVYNFAPVEDDDVRAEAERVRQARSGGSTDTTLLRVEGMVKSYSWGGPKAVNQVSFLVPAGECFGLLGVNGAGKTTLFKMLTGNIAPNSGDAFVTNYSVVSQRRQYLSHVGYCPQFSALLDDLTGEETLKVVAKIRGVPWKRLNAEVSSWLAHLGISEHAKKLTGAYSGGTKRKLSAAMAFIGDPEVVFLDEPTTGVDPVSRRKLWSVVQDRQRAGQAIVLTSHSMEECEALCSRLTIMRTGEMQCVGPVQYLKTKFGKGFYVLVKISNPDAEQFEAFVIDFTAYFPKSFIKDQNVSIINFQIYDPTIPLSRIFSQMIALRDKYEIVEDFIVSNMTLEQLFLSFAKA